VDHGDDLHGRRAGDVEPGCGSRVRRRGAAGSAWGGLAGLLFVAGTVCPDGSGHRDGQGFGGCQGECVVVDVGHPAVEGDRFVGQGQGQGDGEVGVDEAEFAGGDGDAGLAVGIHAVQGLLPSCQST